MNVSCAPTDVVGVVSWAAQLGDEGVERGAAGAEKAEGRNIGETLARGRRVDAVRQKDLVLQNLALRVGQTNDAHLGWGRERGGG